MTANYRWECDALNSGLYGPHTVIKRMVENMSKASDIGQNILNVRIFVFKMEWLLKQKYLSLPCHTPYLMGHFALFTIVPCHPDYISDTPKPCRARVSSGILQRRILQSVAFRRVSEINQKQVYNRKKFLKVIVHQSHYPCTWKSWMKARCSTSIAQNVVSEIALLIFSYENVHQRWVKKQI